MRSAASLVTTFALSVAAIGLAVAAPGADARRAAAALHAASGAVTISNSHAGSAILSAGNVRPGQSASGTVRVGNAGDVAGSFALDADVADSPGPYGGRLSEHVELVISDVTQASQPVTLFAGNPADMGRVSLGTLGAGAQRDYRFTVTLPDGGAGDNAYQGAGLSLGFVWRAAPVSNPVAPPPPPVGTPAPRATPPAGPVGAVDYATALGLPSAKTCVRRGRLKLKLKAPDRSKLASVTVAVNGRTKVRARGAKARKPVTLRGLRKVSKVKVTARTSKRRTYTAARTYRACR